MKAGLKGRERDQPSRSRGLSTRGRGTYAEDKLPVFVLADRGSGERHVSPAKAATESRIRLLLADRQQESLTIYTNGFRVYKPLEEDDAFTREYVVHGDGEYVDGDVHVIPAKATRRWRDGGSRRTEASPKTDSHRISERFSSAVKCSADRVRKRSKPSSELCCDSSTIYATRASGRGTSHLAWSCSTTTLHRHVPHRAAKS